MTNVFFDLDGTLSDSHVGITRSIQYALEKLDIASPGVEKLESYIGDSLSSIFEQLTGNAKLTDKAIGYYRERFKDTGIYENDIYPGIEALLSALVDAGHTLFIATSKPKIFADRIAAHFQIDHYFKDTFGAELDGTRSDKTELLCFALAATNIEPATAIMVGDRHHDIIGARANNMQAIGVLYGFGDRAELEQSGAHHLCLSPDDVYKAVIALS